MRLLGLGLATTILAIAAATAASVPNAQAADLGVGVRHGDGTYVRVHHYRRLLACPDRYSCYPLYGAYGPYGGRAYWTAYSGYVPPEHR